MRWIWTLAIACVIAATGVRPQLEVRQNHTEQLDASDSAQGTLQHLRASGSTLQQLATRHAPRSPEVRNPPFAPPPTAAPSLAPPRIRALAIAWSLRAAHSHFVPAYPARGPPLIG
jgi:hypothetical protein